jgi:hypothetical protein
MAKKSSAALATTPNEPSMPPAAPEQQVAMRLAERAKLLELVAQGERARAQLAQVDSDIRALLAQLGVTAEPAQVEHPKPELVKAGKATSAETKRLIHAIRATGMTLKQVAAACDLKDIGFYAYGKTARPAGVELMAKLRALHAERLKGTQGQLPGLMVAVSKGGAR